MIIQYYLHYFISGIEYTYFLIYVRKCDFNH